MKNHNPCAIVDVLRKKKINGEMEIEMWENGNDPSTDTSEQ